MAAERLTHSKRSSFLFCPRQYYWRYEQGLELAVQRPGRRRGAIFGDALQATRDAVTALRHGLISADGFDRMTAPMESIDQAYAEHFDHVNDLETIIELEIERAKVRVMVKKYIGRYGVDDRREVEYTTSYPNPATGGFSKTWRIAGKIDGMIKVGEKRARLVEDKFVGQIQKAMIDRLPLDAQTTEYVSALATKGWSAEVAYRHTRYPGINPEKAREYKTRDNKPAETLDDFEVRLAEDVDSRPEHYFDEQILYFPTAHLEEFVQERWSVGQMIIEARERERRVGRAAFPKAPTRCWEFGGCPYIPLCTDREGAEALYVVTPGDVELTQDAQYGDEGGTNATD